MRKLLDVNIDLIENINVVCDKHFLQSVTDKGVIEPVILGWDSGCGKYLVKDGKRRVFAARAAELKTVPSVIDDEVDNSEAALIMNLLRSPNLVEEVKALKKLINSGQNTLGEVADILSIPLTSLKKTGRLLNLSDKAIEALETGRIKKGAAFTLASLSKEEQDALIDSSDGKITSDIVEKVRRKSRIENTVDKLFEDDITDNSSSIANEFEGVIAKIMVGDVPQSLKEAVNTLRRYIAGDKDGSHT